MQDPQGGLDEVCRMAVRLEKKTGCPQRDERFPVGLTVRLWAGALWRLALAGALVMLTWQCYNLRNLPGWTERQIEREGEATRAAALSAIGDTRKDVLVRV